MTHACALILDDLNVLERLHCEAWMGWTHDEKVMKRLAWLIPANQRYGSDRNRQMGQAWFHVMPLPSSLSTARF
jgi:hypothetical protein